MEEEKRPVKEKTTPGNLVYALADYKQLVIQYKTKHAQLLKSQVFWKTSALWLCAVAIACGGLAFSMMLENRAQSRENWKNMSAMNNRLQALSDQFQGREQALTAAQEELELKEARIGQLERNLSTASKKQVEKLLKDSEAK